LQGSLFQVDIAQIIVDEADEPNSLVDFFNAEPLSGQDARDVDFLSKDADAAAGSDENVAVVGGIWDPPSSAVAVLPKMTAPASRSAQTDALSRWGNCHGKPRSPSA
jgi:hypothetical protein